MEEKLRPMPEVFALHDLDFGRTDKIKHQFKLSETHFKHRSQPIWPQDLDALWRHRQKLREAGVIRESRVTILLSHNGGQEER